MPRLYPDRVVRLVDGGTCDNQGIGGLLEQDCNVLLVSDGSGQMGSLNDPSRGPLGVALRSTSILQSRVRQAEYQELASRRRSQLLRGLMFVHLKEDLDVDPIDWVECPDPYDADDDDARPAGRKGKLTRYGIDKELQRKLAAVRTDLDSFSDVEAYALMTSAYRMTEHAFGEGSLVEGFNTNASPEGWDFLKVESGMKGIGEPYEQVRRLLAVSDMLAFKILKLKKDALALALAMTLAALAVLVGVIAFAINVAVLTRRSVPFVTAAEATVRDALTNLRGVLTTGVVSISTVVIAVAALVLVSFLLVALFSKKRRVETLGRVLISFAGVVTSLVARAHLLIFDPMFLREGSIERYMRNAPDAAPPRTQGGPPVRAEVAEVRAAEEAIPRATAAAGATQTAPLRQSADEPSTEAATGELSSL
jgi:hypothetical protein